MAYHFSSQSSGMVVIGIVVSLMLASMLNVYPLSASIALWRPMTMMMVLIFWLLFRPEYVGVVIAFIVGLIADLLLDTQLGQQAFAAVVMAFTVKISSIYVKRLTTNSAWLLACVCLLVFQLTMWVLQFITQDIFVASSGLAILTSMLCWPVVLWALRHFA